MDWLDYREKLGIGFNDKGKVKYFYNKISNVLRDLHGRGVCILTAGEYIKFCNMTGTVMNMSGVDGVYFVDEFGEIVEVLFNHMKSLNEFLAFYIAFLNCQDNTIERYYSRDNFKNLLVTGLREAHIQHEVLEDQDGYFVFPAGDPMMDKNLVSDVLSWLDKYPGAKKTYVNALKQYADGIYIRDAADNLRKALETFLQEFLQNDKNLDNNKGEICKYLTSQGVDPSIGGMYKSIISTYKDINDKTVKHNDKIDARLLEFLLYQTGLLIRMVLRVSGQIEGN